MSVRKNKCKQVTAAVLCAAVSAVMLGTGSIRAEEQTEEPVQEVKLPIPIQTIDLDKDVVSGEGCRVDKELEFDNPFGTEEIQNAVREYDTYEEVELFRDLTTYRPVWKKGLTVSYWIKVPSDADAGYLPSGALRWELDQELPQENDYAKYICSSYFDKTYQEMSEEERQAAKKEESKVPYGSDFYFKFLETDGTDEDGAPKAAEHTEGDFTGPVYDNRYFSLSEGEMQVSRYYAFNPNYRRGFLRMSDGVYIAQAKEYAEGYYNDYHTMDIAAGSKVRRADVHGELQIDVDNSVLWVPETEKGIQKNPNAAGYGEPVNMHHMNLFYMNSWTKDGGPRPVSYEAVEHAALSPVTGVRDGAGVKYGNCDEWHQVTVTFQNDKVGFYVDGTEISVTEEYGILGGVDLRLGAFSSFRRVNKGRGLRGTSFFYSEGSDPNNLSYGPTNTQLLMEWLTNEDTKFYIGGAGSCAGEYNLASQANPFYMDDINFYGELLSTEQVQALYQKESAARSGAAEESPKPPAPAQSEQPPVQSQEPAQSAQPKVAGDVDGNGVFDLRDVQTALKLALKIELTDKEIDVQNARKVADVDENNVVNLEDAQRLLKAALIIAPLS